ncbi:MAG: helix-turn-helix transcriptional regulator [Chloroflexi bacterium]|nr:helix-turn-helix transcriptional regulator [Chloroflexota bacterium]
MNPKQIPKRLGEKLRMIREHQGWTLDQMAEELGKISSSRRTRVYEWENGDRQPDLPTLLAYARLVNVPVETLIDDEMDLHLEENSL